MPRVCALPHENAIRHGATEKPVKVEAVGKADEVQIAVHNDGDPILQSEIRRIFEPMKQAEDGPKRAEGLGLGLYIARAIATAHHGAIDVESTKETGTTFTGRLPHHPRACVAERRRVETGRRVTDALRAGFP